MTDSSSTSFNLNSQDGGFKSRCDDVFAGLASLEKKHEAFSTVQSRNRTPRERESLIKQDPKDDPVQPRESSFRHPRGRARRQRYGQGFRRNPQKWTSYDLSDVTRDQLSEKSNTAAALQFLQERRKARESPEERAPADLSQKVEFSYPAKSNYKEGSAKADSTERKFYDGKLVMPEYDMGQKTSKPKRRRVEGSSAAGSSRSVNLNYLQDDDDDDKSSQNKGKITNSETSESGRGLGLGETGGEGERKMGQDSEEEEKVETDRGDKDTESSVSGSTEVKFKKFSGKKGIRRRHRDDDDED